MKLYSLIVDNFLDNFEEFRKHAVSRDYAGITNPSDNVFYPDISIDIPHSIIQEIQYKIEMLMNSSRAWGIHPVGITPKVTFMRMSKAGVPVPHQAHTDSVMGQYTLLLYLNDKNYSGGTSVLRHIETGMDTNPSTPELVKIWERDTNDPSKWEVVSNCPMKPNRAFIIDSNLFHRAEPIGGFGDDNESGRLVLTMFFDWKPNG